MKQPLQQAARAVLFIIPSQLRLQETVVFAVFKHLL